MTLHINVVAFSISCIHLSIYVAASFYTRHRSIYGFDVFAKESTIATRTQDKVYLHMFYTIDCVVHGG